MVGFLNMTIDLLLKIEIVFTLLIIILRGLSKDQLKKIFLSSKDKIRTY